MIKAATENNRHKKKNANQKTLNPSSRNFLYYNLVDHHDFKYVSYFLYSAFVCSRSTESNRTPKKSSLRTVNYVLGLDFISDRVEVRVAIKSAML